MQISFLPACLRVVAAVFFAAATAACGSRDESPTPILFFAAASTQDAVREISSRFEARNQVPVTLNVAASSTLAQQILAGAGSDLFLSANVRWVEEVMTRGLGSRRRDLLGNKLVVIAPAASSLQIRKPSDLLDSRVARLSLADPEGVPAGIYAREALMRLDLWRSLEPKVVRSSDVRQALFFVEQGEAEAGIVYSTDLRISEAVRSVLELDPTLSRPIVYPLVLLESPGDAARHFFEYLLSPESVEVFRRFGFSILSDQATGFRSGLPADQQPPSRSGETTARIPC
jgi:molybdate transport system substrate-binding protein